eukprot:Hpha_TRINITY_DN16050_c2_g4::TRINITY_DN16050_c2_g4_i1::g.121507::m.121507
MHVLLNLDPPQTVLEESCWVTRSLEGCGGGVSEGVEAVRSLVLLQGLVSVGRLCGMIRNQLGHTTPPITSPAEIAERWGAALAGEAVSREDRILDEQQIVVEGRVTGVRFLGRVAFLGISNGGCRLHVVARVHDWGERQYEAMKAVCTGVDLCLQGRVGISSQGRLCLFADRLLSASTPLRGADSLVEITPSGLPEGGVLIVKPAGMLARREGKMQKGDRESVECTMRHGREELQLRVVPEAPPREASGLCLLLPKRAKWREWENAEHTWVALVGCVRGCADHGTCREPLRDLARESRLCGDAERAPHPAATRWRLLHRWPSLGVALAAVERLEGRVTWQLQRHLALSGHPVVGDPHAGERVLNRTFGRTYGFRRSFLHLWKVEPLPGTVYSAPLTHDLLELLQLMPSEAPFDPAVLGLS